MGLGCRQQDLSELGALCLQHQQPVGQRPAAGHLPSAAAGGDLQDHLGLSKLTPRSRIPECVVTVLFRVCGFPPLGCFCLLSLPD